eukprot:3720119-Amphidinium_carterae.1
MIDWMRQSLQRQASCLALESCPSLCCLLSHHFSTRCCPRCQLSTQTSLQFIVIEADMVRDQTQDLEICSKP